MKKKPYKVKMKCLPIEKLYRSLDKKRGQLLVSQAFGETCLFFKEGENYTIIDIIVPKRT